MVDFYGSPHRSVANDKMNELYYSKVYTLIKFAICLCIVFLMIGIEIGLIIGIMHLIVFFGKLF